jgi:hypothetical protein
MLPILGGDAKGERGRCVPSTEGRAPASVHQNGPLGQARRQAAVEAGIAVYALILALPDIDVQVERPAVRGIGV